MSNHFITKDIIDRLYASMKKHGITTSQLCKVLNISYPNFKAMLDGKSPCYNKWQKKIAEALNEDRNELFTGI